MIMSCWKFVRMGNVSEKLLERIRIHILCPITYTPPSQELQLETVNRWEVLCTSSAPTGRRGATKWRDFFFQKSYLLWDNAVKYGAARQSTDENIIWRMRSARWIAKVTDTHPEYVITAFPLQPWSCGRTSMLNYTCIAGLVHMYCSLL
jgi:hypothetical protein